MPNRFSCSPPPEEHLRQLQRVYGPLSPAFVAVELECTLEEAAFQLYGTRAAQHCWVSLADMARLFGVNVVSLKRWVRHHHVQSAQKRGPGRTVPLLIHLDDARHYLYSQWDQAPGTAFPGLDPLPRYAAEDLLAPPAPSHVTRATAVDVDWQLARRAAWPMTVERLAEAVYGSRSAQVQQQARRLVRRWETLGRVICFAGGLYDLVRPSLVLDPGRYGRSSLPREALQKLRAHHPEIVHWSDGSIAAAWRAYSRFYTGAVLPVDDRGEPTFLEYLMVRQLHPDSVPSHMDARYDELCQETVFYRLIPSPSRTAIRTDQHKLTVENIEAGAIDFKALADATRLRMQMNFDKGKALSGSRRATASKALQESV